MKLKSAVLKSAVLALAAIIGAALLASCSGSGGGLQADTFGVVSGTEAPITPSSETIPETTTSTTTIVQGELPSSLELASPDTTAPEPPDSPSSDESICDDSDAVSGFDIDDFADPRIGDLVPQVDSEEEIINVASNAALSFVEAYRVRRDIFLSPRSENQVCISRVFSGAARALELTTLSEVTQGLLVYNVADVPTEVKVISVRSGFAYIAACFEEGEERVVLSGDSQGTTESTRPFLVFSQMAWAGKRFRVLSSMFFTGDCGTKANRRALFSDGLEAFSDRRLGVIEAEIEDGLEWVILNEDQLSEVQIPDWVREGDLPPWVNNS